MKSDKQRCHSRSRFREPPPKWVLKISTLSARETFEAKVLHLNWTPVCSLSLQFRIWLAAPFDMRSIENTMCALRKYNLDSFRGICMLFVPVWVSSVLVDCECELKSIWNIYDFAENVENNNTKRNSRRERMVDADCTQHGVFSSVKMHWWLAASQCTGLHLFSL